MSFDNQLKDWISIDNQIKLLNDKIKNLRLVQKENDTALLSYALKNNMSNTTIQVNGAKVKFADTKVKEALTLAYLEKTLREVIKNEAHVETIMAHINQKRNVKIVPEIKRIYSNPHSRTRSVGQTRHQSK
jgi:hypothetical protein